MRALLRAVVLLGAGATSAGAQSLPPSLHVRGVGEPVAVDVATHRGYPAYPAWTLRTLGARVDGTADGTLVIFGADTLRFVAGSPYFHAGGRAWQLADPPYRERGILYLPHQLFGEWLPRAYPDRLHYDRGRLQLAGTPSTGRVAAVPPEGPPPESPPPESRSEARSRPSEAPAPAETAPAASQPARNRPVPSSSEPDPLDSPADDPVVGTPVAPLVVIDPGHGGPDAGATGPSGVREKDVVLQVSRRLARVLAERGYDVRLTRMADTLIALEDRPHLANEWRGNRPALFFSIHANWVGDRRVRGFETFFLSDARTEDERRVAEMENAAVAYETGPSIADMDELGLIRNNLRNDFYIRASYDLAGLVQAELEDFHRGRDRGVKQAGFIVLIGAVMPAVLVELAFISNPTEERMLGSGSFQVRLAEGIADAVDRFFERQGERWTGSFP